MKRVLELLAMVVAFTFSITTSSCTSSPSPTGTYIEYPNQDKRITRTYVLNNNGSATVTFKGVTDFSNRTETETKTYYGYWEQGSGYIKVIYDDYRSKQCYLDLKEKKVYHGYKSYRSRTCGTEFTKIN